MSAPPPEPKVSIAGFFDLLDDCFERFAFPRDITARCDISAFRFSEAAVHHLHVVQQFTDGVTAVQDGGLMHVAPVNLVATVQKHIAQRCWDVVHELVGLLADFMLVYSFSNDGCQSLGSSLAGLEGQMQHHR